MLFFSRAVLFFLLCVCVSMLTCMCVPLHVHVEAGEQPQMSSSHPGFWDRVIHWTWGSTVSPRDLPVSVSKGLVFQACTNHIRPSYVDSRTQTQVLTLVRASLFQLSHCPAIFCSYRRSKKKKRKEKHVFFPSCSLGLACPLLVTCCWFSVLHFLGTH